MEETSKNNETAQLGIGAVIGRASHKFKQNDETKRKGTRNLQQNVSS